MVDLEPIQLPTYIKKDEKTYSDTYGKFTIGPFEQGFGTTVANSFRRVLLSSIQGGAVRFVKVHGTSASVCCDSWFARRLCRTYS